LIPFGCERDNFVIHYRLAETCPITYSDFWGEITLQLYTTGNESVPFLIVIGERSSSVSVFVMCFFHDIFHKIILLVKLNIMRVIEE
jgi:hypothetical protein